MSSGIASLHKILKDETRRKIILLLHEKGSLSYVDLMKALGIANTGKINYHLKVLGDLLLKMDDGQYALTEKGKLASRLLLEFPEKKSQFQIEAEFFRLPKWLLIAAVIVSAIFVTGFLALYVRGVIDFSRLMVNIFIVVSSIAVLIVADKARKMRAKWSPKRQMLANEIWMITFGALAGLAIFLVGGSLLLFAFETFLQSAGIRFALFPFAWWLIISFVFGPIIGGFVGYLIYKRSKYSKVTYYDPFA